MISPEIKSGQASNDMKILIIIWTYMYQSCKVQ
jgi:hypothetical protein